jgi:hypothetical protein
MVELPELASTLFALGCALASARRLAFVVAPTGLDHQVLLEALGERQGLDARARLASALRAEGKARWEGDLLEAVAEPDPDVRAARVNEQLTELEVLADRWTSVPGVCARLATSVGFLCATVALLDGLADVPVDAESLHGALAGAVGSLTIGIAGTSFCAAVHFRARRARRERAGAADRLVAALSES